MSAYTSGPVSAGPWVLLVTSVRILAFPIVKLLGMEMEIGPGIEIEIGMERGREGKLKPIPRVDVFKVILLLEQDCHL